MNADNEEQMIRRAFHDFSWEGVKKIGYKGQTSGDTFYKVDRQNIISGTDGVNFDVRYFECGQGGFTTLEKHEHVHIVMIARGQGRVIVRDRIYEALPNDFFVIPSWAPHQLVNAGSEPFAFFCSVNARRDKFVLLSREEIRELVKNPKLAEWLKVPDSYFGE
jgi:mannose-6-phosphate isomerase-like protein (cupin superfamily)